MWQDEQKMENGRSNVGKDGQGLGEHMKMASRKSEGIGSGRKKE